MQKNQIFVLFVQKIMGGHETEGGTGEKLGAMPTARASNRHWQ